MSKKYVKAAIEVKYLSQDIVSLLKNIQKNKKDMRDYPNDKMHAARTEANRILLNRLSLLRAQLADAVEEIQRAEFIEEDLAFDEWFT